MTQFIVCFEHVFRVYPIDITFLSVRHCIYCQSVVQIPKRKVIPWQKFTLAMQEYQPKTRTKLVSLNPSVRSANRFPRLSKTFIDKCSGKNMNRPQLKAMLDYVREGDVVVVSDFSRLARSTKDMLQIVQDLTDTGVGLISMKENLDTETPQGKFMLTVFAALAELDRATILQRQREGIEIAKSEGKYKGRKPVPFDEERFPR